MLRISSITVRSLEVDHLNVYWTVADGLEDPYDYTFVVERSEAPMGPWDQVTSPFSDRYEFRDVVVNLFHLWRKYWYRIKVTKKSDDSVSYSEPSCLMAPPDLIAQEVRRLEYLLFQEHIGRVVWVFPRRTFGQRCPACYDKVSGRRLRDQCPTCFDTSYVRGYMDPVASYAQIDPSAKHDETMPLAKTQQQNTTGRMPYFPPLKPGDILVEAENRRWRVERMTPTERRRAVVRQELVLHGLDPVDVEFTLPINVADLRLIQPNAIRDFTNPHTVESGATIRTDALKGSGY